MNLSHQKNLKIRKLLIIKPKRGESKNVNQKNFIYALGIKKKKNGIKTAKDLAKNYKNLDNLRKQLLKNFAINDVGDVVANLFLSF